MLYMVTLETVTPSILEPSTDSRQMPPAAGSLADMPVITQLLTAICLKSPPGLGAQLEGVRRGPQIAVGDGDILRGPAFAQRKASLGHNGVVISFDMAVGDADLPATIRINAVGIAVQDGHPIDIDVIRTE